MEDCADGHRHSAAFRRQPVAPGMSEEERKGAHADGRVGQQHEIVGGDQRQDGQQTLLDGDRAVRRAKLGRLDHLPGGQANQGRAEPQRLGGRQDAREVRQAAELRGQENGRQQQNDGEHELAAFQLGNSHATHINPENGPRLSIVLFHAATRAKGLGCPPALRRNSTE